jgi:hypothetical protein
MQKNKIAIQQWKDASLKNANDHNNILKQKTDEHAKEMQLAEDKLVLLIFGRRGPLKKFNLRHLVVKN